MKCFKTCLNISELDLKNFCPLPFRRLMFASFFTLLSVYPASFRSMTGFHLVWDRMSFLHTRISDHIRISALTGKKLGRHSLCTISHHHRDTGHPVTPNDFSTLNSSSTSFELLVRESLVIKKVKPSSNATLASYPLSLFRITNFAYFNFKPFVILNGNLLLRHFYFYSLSHFQVI